MDQSAPQPGIDDLLAEVQWIRSLAARLVHNEADRSDLVQETLLAAIAKRPDSSRSLRPWLARVLRAQAALLRRKRANVAAREAAVAPREDALPGSDVLAERADMSRTLVEEVVALAEPYRSAILLYYFEGMPTPEIAKRKGIEEATVRTQLRRGRDALRERLDERNGGQRARWVLAMAPLAGSEPAPIPAPALEPSAVTTSMNATSWILLGVASAGLAGWAFVHWGPGAERGAGSTALARDADSGVARNAEQAGPTRGDSTLDGRSSLGVSSSERPASPFASSAPTSTLLVVDSATGEPLPEFAVRFEAGERPVFVSDSAGRIPFVIDDIDLPQLRVTPLDEFEPQVVSKMGHDGMRSEPASLAIERGVDGIHTINVRTGPTFEFDFETADGSPLPPIDGLRTLANRSAKSSAPAVADWEFRSVRVHPGLEDQRPWARLRVPEQALLDEGGPYRLDVRSDDGGWAGTATVPSLESGRHRAQVVLAAKARVTIAALDGEQPIVGAVIVLNGPDAYRQMDGVGRESDSEVRFDALVPGDYTYTVSAPLHDGVRGRFTLGSGERKHIDIELQPRELAGPLSGVLRSRSGRGPSFTLLMIEEPGRVDPPRFVATSWIEEDGVPIAHFEFPPLPNGDFVLWPVETGAHYDWLPSPLEFSTPLDEVSLERLDDVSASDVQFEFELPASVDSSLTILRYRVGAGLWRSIQQKGRAGDWQQRIGGLVWQKYASALLPSVPDSAPIEWVAYGRGVQPMRGTRSDLVRSEADWAASVVLQPGWSSLLRVVVERDRLRAPAAAVDVMIDGRIVGTTDASGRLIIGAERPLERISVGEREIIGGSFELETGTWRDGVVRVESELVLSH